MPKRLLRHILRVGLLWMNILRPRTGPQWLRLTAQSDPARTFKKLKSLVFFLMKKANPDTCEFSIVSNQVTLNVKPVIKRQNNDADVVLLQSPRMHHAVCTRVANGCWSFWHQFPHLNQGHLYSSHIGRHHILSLSELSLPSSLSRLSATHHGQLESE